MAKLHEPDLPFEPLGIDIPDYVKKEGSKASQPFSKYKHDLLRPEALGSKGDGDSDRTDYFKLHLVRMWNELGGPVPYRFRDAHGQKRSMDAGCLKFVGPDGQNLASFDLRDGYIIAVTPKQALIDQMAGLAGITERVRPMPIGSTVDSPLDPGEPTPDYPTEFPEPSSMAIDIRDIQNDRPISQTTCAKLIDARIGQGAFRTRVLARWNGRCAVTGCDLQEAIRASHIVPWRSANNDERINPANGLPLVATLDALFDLGLISFDDTGKVLFSDKLDAKHHNLVPSPQRLTRVPSSATKAYLARHRAEHGFTA